MELPTNPFAILTFISAPAVLTNASCVLLFGTGNRYGRAVDRMHELAEIVLSSDTHWKDGEQKLRTRQLRSAETRTLLIVRALTCFYTAVAGFVISTLVSLVGALLVSTRTPGTTASFAIALLAGCVGVIALVAGAAMLAVETRFSFGVLREENAYLTSQIQQHS